MHTFRFSRRARCGTPFPHVPGGDKSYRIGGRFVSRVDFVKASQPCGIKSAVRAASAWIVRPGFADPCVARTPLSHVAACNFPVGFFLAPRTINVSWNPACSVSEIGNSTGCISNLWNVNRSRTVSLLDSMIRSILSQCAAF